MARKRVDHKTLHDAVACADEQPVTRSSTRTVELDEGHAREAWLTRPGAPLVWLHVVVRMPASLRTPRSPICGASNNAASYRSSKLYATIVAEMLTVMISFITIPFCQPPSPDCDGIPAPQAPCPGSQTQMLLATGSRASVTSEPFAVPATGAGACAGCGDEQLLLLRPTTNCRSPISIAPF